MSNDFEAAITELASSLGGDGRTACADEHVRWRIYEKALAGAASREGARRALKLDPNAPLMSAVVIRALASSDSIERRLWIDVLPPGRQREFAEKRAREWAVYERLIGDVGARVDAREVAGWSQWLQEKLAASVGSEHVLRILAEAGATKRVRNTASRRRLSSP